MTIGQSPDARILAFLCARTQATAAMIGEACRMTPGEVRGCIVTLESSRLVSGSYDKSTPPRRVYALTLEGARGVEP